MMQKRKNDEPCNLNKKDEIVEFLPSTEIFDLANLKRQGNAFYKEYKNIAKLHFFLLRSP